MASRKKVKVEPVIEKRVTRSSGKLTPVPSRPVITNENEKVTLVSDCAQKRLNCCHACGRFRTSKEEARKIIPSGPVRCAGLQLKKSIILLKNVLNIAKAPSFRADRSKKLQECNGTKAGHRESTIYNNRQSIQNEIHRSGKQDICNHKTGGTVFNKHKSEKVERNPIILHDNEAVNHTAERIHQIRKIKLQNDKTDREQSPIQEVILAMNKLIDAVESTINIETNISSHLENIRELKQNFAENYNDAIKERIFNALTKFFALLNTKNNEALSQENNVHECQSDFITSATYEKTQKNKNVHILPSYENVNLRNCGANKTTEISAISNIRSAPQNISALNMNQIGSPYKDMVSSELSENKKINEAGTTSIRSNDSPNNGVNVPNIVDELVVNPRGENPLRITVAEPLTKDISPNSISPIESSSIGEVRLQLSDTNSESSTIPFEYPDFANPDESQFSEETDEFAELFQAIDDIISSMNGVEENDLGGQEKISNTKEQELMEKNVSVDLDTENNLAISLKRKEISKNRSVHVDNFNNSDSEKEESSPSKVDALLLELAKSQKNRRKSIYTSTEEEDDEEITPSKSQHKQKQANDELSRCDISKRREKVSRNMHRKQKFNTTTNETNGTLEISEDSSIICELEVIDLTQDESTEINKPNRFELEIQILREIMKKRQAESTSLSSQPINQNVSNIETSSGSPANKSHQEDSHSEIPCISELEISNTNTQPELKETLESSNIEPIIETSSGSAGNKSPQEEGHSEIPCSSESTVSTSKTQPELNEFLESSETEPIIETSSGSPANKSHQEEGHSEKPCSSESEVSNTKTQPELIEFLESSNTEPIIETASGSPGNKTPQEESHSEIPCSSESEVSTTKTQPELNEILESSETEPIIETSSGSPGNKSPQKEGHSEIPCSSELEVANSKTQAEVNEFSESPSNEPIVNTMISPKSAEKRKSTEEISPTSSIENKYSSDVDAPQIKDEPKKKKKLRILENLPKPKDNDAFNKVKVKSSKDKATLPKTLGFKVKSILSVSEQLIPSSSKKSNKNKRKLTNDSHSPERRWKPVNILETTDFKVSVSRQREYKPKSLNTPTDFVVQPLHIKHKNSSNVPEYFSSNALEFKRKAVFNDKIRRESSKDLLSRKIKKKF